MLHLASHCGISFRLTTGFTYFSLVLTICKQKPTSYPTWMDGSFKCVWHKIPPCKYYEELPGKYMILVSVAYFNDYLTASINLPCYMILVSVAYFNDYLTSSINLPCSKQMICHSCENWRRKFIPIIIFKCHLLQLKIQEITYSIYKSKKPCRLLYCFELRFWLLILAWSLHLFEMGGMKWTAYTILKELVMKKLRVLSFCS